MQTLASTPQGDGAHERAAHHAGDYLVGIIELDSTPPLTGEWTVPGIPHENYWFLGGA